MFVLSYVRPATDGAKYGKATVEEPVTHLQYALDKAGDVLIEAEVRTMAARLFGNAMCTTPTGTEVTHEDTGIVFRIDPTGEAPNACGCCGRLVRPGDHAFAGTEDAFCDGCYTWGEAGKIPCSPHHTAHPNPWSIQSIGARFCMQVVIDLGDETTNDVRYSRTATHEMWDDEDNALIAWPGLTRDRFLSIDITEINKES
jgi:hypothetical protein